MSHHDDNPEKMARMRDWLEIAAREVAVDPSVLTDVEQPLLDMTHNNGSVASGVRSRGEIPVPPVVTTSRHPFSSASLKALPTESIPSGTTVTGSTLSQLYPNSASIEAAKGPDRSKAAPAAQRSETVMMRALISSTQSILSRSDQRSRRPVLGISH